MVFKKSALLFLLYAVTLSACGQQKEKYEKTDIKSSNAAYRALNDTLYRLQEKVELQAFELYVCRNLHSIDTINHGSDSAIVLFKGQDGTILKKIKRVWEKSSREDSTVGFYKNGLLVYQESWGDSYTKTGSVAKDKIWVKEKLTYARYKYDSQSRLIWQMKLLGDGTFGEDTIIYNANGKPTRHTKRIPDGRTLFWSLETTGYKLQEKIELQALELNVCRNLQSVDTVRYNNDSVVVFFKGQDDTILKKIKEFVWKISGNEDSSIYYFNKNGLIVYEEFWKGNYTKINLIQVKSKLSFARYEYDSDGKLIRRFKLIPDEYLLDTKITYDAHGNPIRDTKRIAGGRYFFWGSMKETLEK